MSLKQLMPNLGKRFLPARREEDPFSRLQEEMNLVFNRFSRGLGMPSFWGAPMDMPEDGLAGAWMPSADVTETDKEVRVTAELPGLDEKDVSVAVSDDTLTISGEKKYEKEEKGKNRFRSEISYGSFHRSFALPAEVDGAKAEATFKKGVLTVTLPKAAANQSKVKKITVKSG